MGKDTFEIDGCFNKERKETFMRTLPAPFTVVPLFKLSAEMELSLNKDLCDFNRDDAETFFKGLKSKSVGTLNVYNVYLKRYTKWCIEEGVSTANNNIYLSFSQEELAEFVDMDAVAKGIVTKEMLERVCAEFKNPSDRFIFRAVFEGIGGPNLDEFSNLSLSDFDLFENMVTLRRTVAGIKTVRQIPVSPDLARDAMLAAQETNYLTEKGISKKLVGPSDLIVKDFANTSCGETAHEQSFHRACVNRRIRDRISRLSSMYGLPNVTTQSLKMSGIINFIIRECDVLDMTLEEFLYSKNFDSIEEQFDYTVIRSSFIRLYKDYFIKHKDINDNEINKELFIKDIQYAYENELGYSHEFRSSGSYMTNPVIDIGSLHITGSLIELESVGGGYSSTINAGMFKDYIRTTDNGFTVYSFSDNEKKCKITYTFPFVLDTQD